MGWDCESDPPRVSYLFPSFNKSEPLHVGFQKRVFLDIVKNAWDFSKGFPEDVNVEFQFSLGHPREQFVHSLRVLGLSLSLASKSSAPRLTTVPYHIPSDGSKQY